MKKPKLSEVLPLLKRIQQKHLREPDSDLLERCHGCGRSPYNKPQHADGCLVPELGEMINRMELFASRGTL